MKPFFLSAIILVSFISGCNYVKLMARQYDIENSLEKKPSKVLEKELADSKNYVVYGYLSNTDSINGPFLVTAVDQEYGKLEIVDFFEMKEAGFYTFYLPKGQYSFHIFRDKNGDGYYRSDECIIEDSLETDYLVLGQDENQSTVIKKDVALSNLIRNSQIDLSYEVGGEKKIIVSEKFPPGSIRDLEDEIFKIQYGVLGLYNPSAFVKISSLYFYALEDHDPRKIPILFVHGIGGSPVEFKKIVQDIDREIYQPWFFYYPSGRDLDDIADVMYEIFFSGKLATIKRRRLIVIAHSMGGLVARAAINKYAEVERNNDIIKAFITISSPFGGHDAAAAGIERAPVVLPVWKNMAPKSEFITNLHKSELPKHMDYHLFFSYNNPDPGSTKNNSDGSVDLKSQLDPRVQFVTPYIYGFNENHVSILESDFVIKKINDILGYY